MLRKKLKVPLPIMHSEEHPTFNCAQRVHQNTLESLPFFFANLAFGGLRYPIYAAAFGLVWLIGRVVFSVGYYTGKPKFRMPGALLSMFGGLMPLFGLAIASGIAFVTLEK